jgi:hypothetical protein
MSIIKTSESQRLKHLDLILNPRYTQDGQKLMPIICTPNGKMTMQLYSSTNENLSFINELDVANKDCLTTGSSCDQLFTLIANGANRADLFDINPFTIDFFELKKQVILHMSSTTAWGFLTCYQENKYFLHPALFRKVKPHLSAFEQEFWQKVVDSPNKMNLFRSDGVRVTRQRYLSDRETFANLRRNLKSCQVNIYEMSLSSLRNLPHSYQVVLFSNIAEWYKSTESFFEDAENFIAQTTPDALIQMGYFWKDFESNPQSVQMQYRYGEALVPILATRRYSMQYATILDKSRYIKLINSRSDYPFKAPEREILKSDPTHTNDALIDTAINTIEPPKRATTQSSLDDDENSGD